MSRVSPGVLAPPHEILTPGEWRASGRARREPVPRTSRAEWSPPPGRPGPVAILEEWARTRVAGLVPIRCSAVPPEKAVRRSCRHVPATGPGQLGRRGRLCGWPLARGHARTGRATAISGCLSESKDSGQVIADFALACAEQNAKDYQCLMDAAANARVQAVLGLLTAGPQPRLTGPLLRRGTGGRGRALRPRPRR